MILSSILLQTKILVLPQEQLHLIRMEVRMVLYHRLLLLDLEMFHLPLALCLPRLLDLDNLEFLLLLEEDLLPLLMSIFLLTYEKSTTLKLNWTKKIHL